MQYPAVGIALVYLQFKWQPAIGAGVCSITDSRDVLSACRGW